MSTTTYRTTRTIGFADCDMAGIVFYPRYFEMINSVIEDWFKHTLKVPFRQLHQDNGEAIPAVEINTRFLAMSRIDEKLDFALEVEKLGNSSLTLNITATCGMEERLFSNITIVHVDLKSGKASPWSQALKERMSA